MTANALLPMGLAFIMFSIGLGLKLEDFTRIAHYPIAILAGLANQMLLLPAIGFLVLLGYEGRPEFALGLMILAASPGGITANLLTALAGGNAALSISMTAISSIASVVSVPVIISVSQIMLLGDGPDIRMPVGRIVASVMVVTAIPIALGMVIHARNSDWSEALRPWARRSATVVFVLIVISAFVGQMDSIQTNFDEIGLRLLALNVLTILCGWSTAKLLKLSHADSVAITLECGLQNVALAIFVAISVLGQPILVIPAITYALIMNLTAGGYIFWLRRSKQAVVSSSSA